MGQSSDRKLRAKVLRKNMMEFEWGSYVVEDAPKTDNCARGFPAPPKRRAIVQALPSLRLLFIMVTLEHKGNASTFKMIDQLSRDRAVREAISRQQRSAAEANAIPCK